MEALFIVLSFTKSLFTSLVVNVCKNFFVSGPSMIIKLLLVSFAKLGFSKGLKFSPLGGSLEKRKTKRFSNLFIYNYLKLIQSKIKIH